MADTPRVPPQPPDPPAPGAPTEGDGLDRFLGAFERFIDQVANEAAAASPEGEARALIASTGQSLREQAASLSRYTSESAGRLTPIQRREVLSFLEVANGERLASRGVETVGTVMKGGLVKNLLHWIAQHLKELKKILLEILHFIFDLLGIPWPKWLDRLIQILDQILDLLLSLLSDVFGIEFRIAARTFSELEVNFWRELAAFESLRQAQAGRSPKAEEA